jgi:hypothetical protein
VIFVFGDESMALVVANYADTLVRGRLASLEAARWPGS